MYANLQTKVPPLDLSTFFAQPANLAVFGLIGLFLFFLVLRASKETAFVAVAVAAIGVMVTTA